MRLEEFTVERKERHENFGSIRKKVLGDQICLHIKAYSSDENPESAYELIQQIIDSCIDQYCFLVLDLSRLNNIPMQLIWRWCKLFVHNRRWLKKNVRFTTILSQNSNIHIAVNIGLKFYTPIRPFYIISDIKEVDTHINGNDYPTRS